MLDVLRRQFTWTDWANHAALAALRRASPAPVAAVRRLAHLAATEHLWLSRLERRPQPMPVWPDLDLDATAALLDELPELWKRYFERAGEAGLTGKRRLHQLQGRVVHQPRRRRAPPCREPRRLPSRSDRERPAQLGR
jgi:uncharacterized damage-inducible protein DinB